MGFPRDLEAARAAVVVVVVVVVGAGCQTLVPHLNVRIQGRAD